MTSGSYQSRPSMLHWTQWYSAMVPWTCFHCSPFRWHPDFQSVIITQPSMFDFVCVLFPIFRYHNESPTHFDSIIENALPLVMGHMGHGSSIQWVTWVMGHSKWPIAYPGRRHCRPQWSERNVLSDQSRPWCFPVDLRQTACESSETEGRKSLSDHWKRPWPVCRFTIPHGAMHNADCAVACLSVCMSVTCRFCVEMAKLIIKLFTLLGIATSVASWRMLFLILRSLLCCYYWVLPF